MSQDRIKELKKRIVELESEIATLKAQLRGKP